MRPSAALVTTLVVAWSVEAGAQQGRPPAPASSSPPPLTAVAAQTCLDAAEQGQRARNAADLIGARARFEVCALPECPRIVRDDCTRWVEEVIVQTPTIVLSATDEAGRDLVEVSTSIDGAPHSDHLDGREVPVNPGPHDVRITRSSPPGSLRERVLVRSGEKRRIVALRFAAGSAGDGTGREPSRPVPPLTYLLGGFALVAGGSAVALALSANGDVLDARRRCAPSCEPTALDGVDTKRTLAWVAAGVGVVSLAAATYVFFTRPTVSSTPVVTAGVGMAGGGPVASFALRF